MRWWKRKEDKQQGFVSCLSEISEKAPANPGRGWYSVFPFRIGDKPDMDALSWCVNPEDRLAQILIDIGQCRGEDISEEMLEHVRQIFGFFASCGQEMIVRTVYDTEGKGLEREPSFLERIQRHMEQIGPVFREYSENICTLQGLFVGSWGEMHHSRHLSGKKLKKLAETLWKATGESCCIAVRTPWQKRLLEDTCVPADKVGIFNDGLFGSETHLGTFGAQADTGMRGEPWLPGLELDYLEENARRTPNGGEAVWGGEFDGVQVVEVLKKMHISYLNRTYDERILEHWRQQPYKNGETLYEYIGGHLGYRFSVKRVWIDGHSLYIEGKNEGFGNLYKKACVRLIGLLLPETENAFLKEAAEEFSKTQMWEESWISEKKEWKAAAVDLKENPSQWECGRDFILRGSLPGEPAGKGENAGPLLLFLEVKQSDGAYIHFVNGSAENRLFLGFIPRWKIVR